MLACFIVSFSNSTLLFILLQGFLIHCTNYKHMYKKKSDSNNRNIGLKTKQAKNFQILIKLHQYHVEYSIYFTVYTSKKIKFYLAVDIKGIQWLGRQFLLHSLIYSSKNPHISLKNWRNSYWDLPHNQN